MGKFLRCTAYPAAFWRCIRVCTIRINPVNCVNQEQGDKQHLSLEQTESR